MECQKVYVQNRDEIHVVVSLLPDVSPYDRLRFQLLASTWLPRPLGILLWSTLHMLLIVSASILLTLMTLILFTSRVLWDAFSCVLFAYIVCAKGVLFFIVVVLLGGLFVLWKGSLLLLCGFLRLCASLVVENNSRVVRLRRVSHAFVEGFQAWWNEACSDLVRNWKETKELIKASFTECVHGSSFRYVQREWRRSGPVLARWGQEVVHMHDAIVV